MDTNKIGQEYFKKLYKVDSIFTEDYEKINKAEMVNIVNDSIRTKGYWEDNCEWRISTVMTSRIETETIGEKLYYKVSVDNEVKVHCYCPTIIRALNYLVVLQESSKDMFWSIGWSTWAERGRFDPIEGEL